MRAVVQRVSEASVTVDGEVVGAIERGLLVLVGVREGDTRAEAEWLAAKIAGLRIFSDDDGRFNLSLLDVGGAALVVSQFTLYGDARKGRRPDFTKAARPEAAEPLVAYFVAQMRAAGVPTAEGRFGAAMAVQLVNQGPVTILLEREAEA
ncbi:MAG: D-aminoacyl-tRNA deacylase [Anaerolineae bacterium]